MVTEKQFIEAQQAFDVALLNGLVSVIAKLRGNGALSAADARSIYDAVSKPLALADNAANPAVQDLQQLIDGFFAALSMEP